VKDEKLGAGDKKKIPAAKQKGLGLERKLSEKSIDSQNRPESSKGARHNPSGNGN